MRSVKNGMAWCCLCSQWMQRAEKIRQLEYCSEFLWSCFIFLVGVVRQPHCFTREHPSSRPRAHLLRPQLCRTL